MPTASTSDSQRREGQARVVNGVRLHYEEHGTGPPILGIHGARQLRTVVGRSRPRRWPGSAVLITYDRRGCSRSERLSPTSGRRWPSRPRMPPLCSTPSMPRRRWSSGAATAAPWRPSSPCAIAVTSGRSRCWRPTRSGSRRPRWRGRATLRDRLRAVADADGVDAVYAALIDEILGSEAWASFPAAVQQVAQPTTVPPCSPSSATSTSRCPGGARSPRSTCRCSCSPPRSPRPSSGR